jgi:hypothetical protein
MNLWKLAWMFQDLFTDNPEELRIFIGGEAWSITLTKKIDVILASYGLLQGWFSFLAASPGETVFLVLGIIWLASSDGKGLTLFRDKPDNMRTLLKGTTIGLLILASLALIANAIP